MLPLMVQKVVQTDFREGHRRASRKALRSCYLALQNLVYKPVGQLLSNGFHSPVKNILSRRALDPLLLHLLKLGTQGHCGEQTTSGEELVETFAQFWKNFGSQSSPLREKIF